ncbi:hypothetical protein [Labilibaculum sp.]|uniref:hypothetical protein n=1 Tax=Labilibaculum sp. TaxID=2060723 RepID=UPI00356A9975
MKLKNQLLNISITGAFIILISIFLMSFNNSDTPNPVGTYQISTTMSSEFNMVLETVIDTRTGEVVSRNKVGLVKYDKVKKEK